MKRQPRRSKCMINIGEFIYLKGNHVTARWKAEKLNDDGTVTFISDGPVKKEYIHPSIFFTPGRPMWKGGLPAYPANKTLELYYHAFLCKSDALQMMKAFIKIQSRLTKIQSPTKILACRGTLEKALKDLKQNLKSP